MKRLVAVILCILLIPALTGAFIQRYALACALLPHVGYEQLDSELYLAPDVDPALAEELPHLIAAAKERISQTYGPPVSSPRLLVTSSAETAARWGANATATMHRLPWGSCIIVGPEGQNTDVIAHEWFHAEIQHRVGFWRFLVEIPVWFDEGASLKVDHRPPFLPENIRLDDDTINAVRALGSGHDFFSGDVGQHYQAARLAVEPLIEDKLFYDALDSIRKGEDFDKVFLDGH